MELVKFYFLSVLPTSVAILSVDPYVLFMAPGDLYSILVLGTHTVASKLDLIRHSCQNLDVTDVAFEVLPTRCAKEAIPLGV